MKLHVKKLPIILPLLLVAALLIASALSLRFGRDSAAEHTDLGQKYLNDMNYSGAITEFLHSLSLDPTAQDARLGLAEAYIASGSPELAADILAPLTEANLPEAYRLLIDSQRETDPSQALLTAQKLVEQTDSEEDYNVRDELLARVLSEPHSYARGTDQQLVIRGGELHSAGSNTLGQLGTAQFLATERTQDGFRPADFPGQAARAYCGGRTSYVVDRDGNLWAAGENRWGQLGMRYASAAPESGWTRIVDTGDVADVSGSVGTLYILKTDGSLWYAGQGGVAELRRLGELGPVAALASGDRQTAVLTLSGELYVSDGNSPQRWTRQARHVKNFCFGAGQLIWVTEDDRIVFQNSSLPLPDTWIWDGQGVAPGFAVRDMAAGANGLLLQDTAGRLWRVFDGQAYELDGVPVANIYSAGESVVVEQEDGTAALWDLSLPDFEEIAL